MSIFKKLFKKDNQKIKLEFLACKGNADLWKWLSTFSENEIIQFSNDFSFKNINLSQKKLLNDVNLNPRFQLICFLISTLLAYKVLLEEKPELNLHTTLPNEELVNILINKLINFLGKQKNKDIAIIYRKVLVELGRDLMKANRDREALECFLVSYPSEEKDHLLGTLGCRFNIASTTKKLEDINVAIDLAEQIIKGKTEVGVQGKTMANDLLIKLKELRGDKKELNQLTIDDKKIIIKEFNEIKEFLRKDMDKMTIRPGEDPIMRIALAAKQSIIEAESKVCVKYKISKETLYSIQKELENKNSQPKDSEKKTDREIKTNMKLDNISPNELCSMAKEGNLKKVILILDHPDCDINMRESGLTALMWAAHHGHLQIVKELIQRGADIDLINDSGWTALLAASQQGFVKIVESLISAGANVNAADSDGWNALMRAKQNGHTSIINMLKNAGAKLGPGVMWCPGCRNFITSSSRRLMDLMPNANVISMGGSSNNCQRCGSRLETV